MKSNKNNNWYKGIDVEAINFEGNINLTVNQSCLSFLFHNSTFKSTQYLHLSVRLHYSYAMFLFCQCKDRQNNSNSLWRCPTTYSQIPLPRQQRPTDRHLLDIDLTLSHRIDVWSMPIRGSSLSWYNLVKFKTIQSIADYNVVQYNMILHTSFQKRRQNINQSLDHKRHPIPCPKGRAMECILEKVDCVMTVLHSIEYSNSVTKAEHKPDSQNNSRKTPHTSPSPVSLLSYWLFLVFWINWSCYNGTSLHSTQQNWTCFFNNL